MGFGWACKEKITSFFALQEETPAIHWKQGLVNARRVSPPNQTRFERTCPRLVMTMAARTQYFVKDEVSGLRIMGEKKSGRRTNQMQPAGLRAQNEIVIFNG